MKCQITEQVKECVCTEPMNLCNEWKTSQIVKVFIGTKPSLEKTLQRYIYCTPM